MQLCWGCYGLAGDIFLAAQQSVLQSISDVRTAFSISRSLIQSRTSCSNTLTLPCFCVFMAVRMQKSQTDVQPFSHIILISRCLMPQQHQSHRKLVCRVLLTINNIPLDREEENTGPMTIAYSPYLKGIIAPMSKNIKNQVMRLFSDEKREWIELLPAFAHGYHGLARENPFRQETLFIGVTHSDALAIVDKDGNIHRMKDCPFTCGIPGMIVTVDPQSGRYLIMDTPR